MTHRRSRSTSRCATNSIPMARPTCCFRSSDTSPKRCASRQRRRDGSSAKPLSASRPKVRSSGLEEPLLPASRHEEVDEPGQMLPKEEPKLSVPCKDELALSLRDGANHHSSRAITRPHQLGRTGIAPLRIVDAAIVHLIDLALDESWMDGRHAHA